MQRGFTAPAAGPRAQQWARPLWLGPALLVLVRACCLRFGTAVTGMRAQSTSQHAMPVRIPSVPVRGSPAPPPPFEKLHPRSHTHPPPLQCLGSVPMSQPDAGAHRAALTAFAAGASPAESVRRGAGAGAGCRAHTRRPQGWERGGRCGRGMLRQDEEDDEDCDEESSHVEEEEDEDSSSGVPPGEVSPRHRPLFLFGGRTDVRVMRACMAMYTYGNERVQGGSM